MKALSRRSGPLLFLTELLISILVLAVAAAFCVGLFSSAHMERQKSASLNLAVSLAQNAAETFKSQGDTLSGLVSDFKADDSVLNLGYDNNGVPCDINSAAYVLRLDVSSKNGLAQGDISVFNAAGDELYSLSVCALQEVSP